MDLQDFFSNKNSTAKQKVENLAKLLISRKLDMKELIRFSETSKDVVLGSCIEAMELAAQKEPSLISTAAFDLVSAQLQHKAPRVKWESAKVIARSAHLFPKKLNAVIPSLLDNTEHSGTVVRWSAAMALTEILRLGKHKELAPIFEAIIKREEKNSIRKIYEAALKETAKK